MTESASCPNCGSYSVTPTTPPHDGKCEYRCDDCGEYFVGDAPPDMMDDIVVAASQTPVIHRRQI